MTYRELIVKWELEYRELMSNYPYIEYAALTISSNFWNSVLISIAKNYNFVTVLEVGTNSENLFRGKPVYIITNKQDIVLFTFKHSPRASRFSSNTR